jgi:hypothetical protein
MNRILGVGLLIAAIVAGGIAWSMRGEKPLPSGDLRAAFASGPPEHRARDARCLSAIAGLAAAVLEADSQKKEPHLKTAGDAATLRADLRAIATGGLSLAATYPALPEVLGDFFLARVGDDDGPLTPERRKKWIEAFAALRDAAGTVADSF